VGAGDARLDLRLVRNRVITTRRRKILTEPETGRTGARERHLVPLQLKDGRAPGEKSWTWGRPQRSKGRGLIRAYGCSGCHLIAGMEKESRVSVSLSNFGRKRVKRWISEIRRSPTPGKNGCPPS